MADIDTSLLNNGFDLCSLSNGLDGSLLKEKGSNISSLKNGKASGISPTDKDVENSASLDNATTTGTSTTSTSDSSSSDDSTVPPYTPVTPISEIEDQLSWITDASVEDVSYVLIILVYVILIMGYYDLQMNDLANVMAAETPMTSDLTTIANELSTLQSAVQYDPDNGDYTVNKSIFTEQDAENLADAFSDLFWSDSNNDLTWDDMAIEWDGTTYYLQPDGTWSTTAYDGDHYGVTGDSSVSDAGMYEFANAVYAVDMASYTGGTLDTSEVFPTESPYDNPADPIMSSLGQLYEAFDQSGVMYYMGMYEEDPAYAGAMWQELTSLGEQYGDSIQNGGGSTLTNLISLTNNALTQAGNVSTQQTNTIQQLTQELETMDQLAQTIIQDASQANANMVNNQVV